MNVIGLSPKKVTILLPPKLFTEYEYSDHTQKIFTSFEHAVSSDKYRFTLLN